MKYYLKHDKQFIKHANLKYFNKNIIDINGNLENNYIYNIVKQAPLNSSILDVGAWKGDTAIYLANRLKQINRGDIKIYCFEPDKSHCNYIEKIKNYSKLNIVVINSIISNKQQTLYMKKNEGSGTMYDSCYSDNNTSYVSKKLDDFDIKNIFFTKIDVEGHEPEVLEGGKNILNQSMYLYIEIWNDEHYKSRHKINLNGSHNERIINQIKNINENFYPIQKIEKNILFKKEVNGNIGNNNYYNVSKRFSTMKMRLY